MELSSRKALVCRKGICYCEHELGAFGRACCLNRWRIKNCAKREIRLCGVSMDRTNEQRDAEASPLARRKGSGD
jgi:hypothetical protein